MCVRGGLTSALSRLGIGCNILGYDGPQLCSVADSASKKKENHPGLWLLKTAVSFRLCQNEVGR